MIIKISIPMLRGGTDNIEVPHGKPGKGNIKHTP